MKKLFLLSGFTAATISVFAQRVDVRREQVIPTAVSPTNGVASKPTRIGDTQIITHIPDTAQLVAYYLGANSDSGLLNGTNYYNDQSFAERFNFNGADSAMQVIGLYAQFTGKVNIASTKTVTFKLWDEGEQRLVSSTMAYNGFPNRVINSLDVPVTLLGIGSTPTLNKYMFANPSMRWGNFFVGYTMNYDFSALNGDTIAIASSRDGQRKGNVYSLSINISDYGDTSVMKIFNVQNATQTLDGTWIDNYTQNDSLLNNLAIYPIVVINAPTSVKGITKKDLTLFGAFPNPASNAVNVKFELAKEADVNVQIMDMSDRMVKTTTKNNIGAGAHTMQLDLSDLPNGSYIYLIKTSLGDGIAGKIEVFK